MAITSTFSLVRPEVIPLNGKVQVMLGLTAVPELLAKPTDLILVLENSAGMTTALQKEMKTGARALIRGIAAATGGRPAAPMGNGVRVALVAYNHQALTGVNLTDQTARLEEAIEALPPGSGGVNQTAALELAAELLKGSTRQKAIVFLAVHQDTAGGDSTAAADAAKEAGALIYGLGPERRQGDLRRWVSAPEDFYCAVGGDRDPLTAAFRKTARTLTAKSTTGLVLKSTVGPEFEISRVLRITHGAASAGDPRTMIWKVGDLGIHGPEKAQVVYEMCHIGSTPGKKPATRTNLLTSCQEEDRIIPDPMLIVTADGSTPAEGCPVPVEVVVPGCEDIVHARLGDLGLSHLGRVVQVSFLLKAICPGKRVAVTVILEEVDVCGAVHPRGMKHLLIPAQSGSICRDVEVDCLPFSVPEELDPDGCTDSICNPRTFQVRVIANYVDSDFTCCKALQVTP